LVDAQQDRRIPVRSLSQEMDGDVGDKLGQFPQVLRGSRLDAIGDDHDFVVGRHASQLPF
jgi:hypothetical protein